MARATALPAIPALRDEGRSASASNAKPKSAPSARARKSRPTRAPATVPARTSPSAARAKATKKNVPRSAAIANESSVTQAGANVKPPSPASAAATRAARADAPMERAATYAAAGTKAVTAMIAACAERKVPTLYRVHERPNPRAVEALVGKLAALDVPGLRMVRIGLRPSWVGVIDFRERFPGRTPALAPHPGRLRDTSAPLPKFVIHRGTP